jgi:Rod binding domain-containing protein
MKAPVAGIGVQRPIPESGGKPDSKLTKAARKFEAMVIGILIQEMWKTIPKKGIAGESTGMDVAQGMFQRELARDLERGGGLGLASEILSQSRADVPKWPLEGPRSGEIEDFPESRDRVNFRA